MPLRKQQPALDGGSEQTPSPAADLDSKNGEEPILSQRLEFPVDDVVGKLTKMMDAIEVENKLPTPEPMPLQESLPAVAQLEVPDHLPLETIAQPVATMEAVDPYDDNGKALLKAGGIPEPIISPPPSRNVSSTELDPDSQNPDPSPEETPPGIVRSGSAAHEDSLTKKQYKSI